MSPRYVLLGAGLALLAFSFQGAANHDNQEPDAIVFIREFEYDPGGDAPVLQTSPGILILFFNADSLVHTVDSVGPSWEVHSGPLATGDHFALTAPGTGAYEIHCTTNEIHTARMHMLLVVS